MKRYSFIVGLLLSIMAGSTAVAAEVAGKISVSGRASITTEGIVRPLKNEATLYLFDQTISTEINSSASLMLANGEVAIDVIEGSEVQIGSNSPLNVGLNSGTIVINVGQSANFVISHLETKIDVATLASGAISVSVDNGRIGFSAIKGDAMLDTGGSIYRLAEGYANIINPVGAEIVNVALPVNTNTGSNNSRGLFWWLVGGGAAGAGALLYKDSSDRRKRRNRGSAVNGNPNVGSPAG